MAKTGTRGSSASVEVAEKHARALNLRRSGATYQQIAEQLGYANRGMAYRIVSEELAKVTAEPAEALLQLELDRLDTMLLGLWPKARTGHAESVRAVLRIMERRSRYLGLDDFESRMADVAERRIALEEAQALVVVAAIQRMLGRLDLTPEQERLAASVVPEELRAIEAGDGEGKVAS